MTKQQTLDLLMLLAALESWAFSVGKPLPDYLHDDLANSIDALSVNLVGANNDKPA